MTHDTIAAILGEVPSARREGDTFVLPAEVEATLYVGTPGSLLNVDKIQRVDLTKDYLVLETSKRERFFFDCADVVGLKLELPEPGRLGRSTGFR
jgi:hypothetical protein